MNVRRVLLVLFSPFLLALVISAMVIGFSFYADSDPATSLINAIGPLEEQQARVIYLLARVLLFPFQLVFIALILGAALWLFRRRERIAHWVLGTPVTGRLATVEIYGEQLPVVFRQERRLTLQQLMASLIALFVMIAAFVFSLGQFVPRGDLAVVITALTSSLTWGARLPVGDILGGISSLFEGSYDIGDRIFYGQLDQRVEGIVESVDLQFLAVRADSGELTTVPHGDLRIYRNYSRGNHVGVYSTFPVAAQDLSRAVGLLNQLAPYSPDLVPLLVEPWQPMSLTGRLGEVVDVDLYGKTTQGNEDDLQLALHALVRIRFAAAGIPLQGRKKAE